MLIMLSAANYAQNYAGIIGKAPTAQCQKSTFFAFCIWVDILWTIAPMHEDEIAQEYRETILFSKYLLKVKFYG